MPDGNPIEAFCEGTISLRAALAEIDTVFTTNDASRQDELLATISRPDLTEVISIHSFQQFKDRIDAGRAMSRMSSAPTAGAANPLTVDAGTILKDRFEIQERIGEGGMGVVYKALDRRRVEAQDRNPFVAVKVLHEQFKDNPALLNALRREARKAQMLAHPNIITVYDFDRDGEIFFMSMEYLEGTSLDRLMKQSGGVPIEEALRIVTKVAEALSYAHDSGIIHSDLKPSNIFVTRNGRVKVIDFGIARAVPRLDGFGDMTKFDPKSLRALTPAYASIEMLEDFDPDPRDDIFGLACITYELVQGRHPFNRLLATVARANGMKPARPKSLNKKQWAGLLRALAFGRDERVSTATEFIRALAAVEPERRLAVSVLAAVSAAAVAAGGVYIAVAPAGWWFRETTSVVAAGGPAGAGRLPENGRQQEVELQAEIRNTETARLEAERQAAEAKREADARAAQAARMESERQAREDKRQADVRAAEAARLESERQAAEAKRQAEARADAARQESERQAAEAKRQAEARAADAARQESERQAAEAKRQAEARASEAARIERERQAAETARLAEAHAAEAARPSEASGVAAASAAAGAPNHGKSGGAEAEPGTTPFSGVFVSAKPVRAVDKPVPGGKTVATIQPWQRLAVTGRTENGDWLRVGIDGQNRWVAAQDVVPERTAEELAWSRISKDAGAGVLATFLKRFPDGAYAERAKDRLAQVRSQEKARSDMARDLAEEEATGGGSAEARRSGSSRPASLPTGSTAATEAIPSRSGASGGEATASAPAPRDGDVEHGGLPGVAMSELYDQAMALVARRDYPGAERLLQRIATEPASGQIGVTAKYRLADILLKEGDYARSAIAFAEFQQSYPQDSNLPNALLGYAEALGQLGRRSEACLGLIKLTKQFPGVSPEMKEQQRAAMRRFSC